MKFIEFAGSYINIEKVRVIRARLNKDCIVRAHDDDGGIHEIIKGKPYEIIIDFGGQDTMCIKYSSESERDSEFRSFINLPGLSRIDGTLVNLAMINNVRCESSDVSYEIVIDFGNQDYIRMGYESDHERNINFSRFLDILNVNS